MREDHCLETVPENGQDDEYADDGKEDEHNTIPPDCSWCLLAAAGVAFFSFKDMRFYFPCLNSQGGVGFGSLHKPILSYLATISRLSQSSQNAALQYFW